jgi:hypothetical protein
MLKCDVICSYAQNQALCAHIWAENGSKTAEKWVRRQKWSDETEGELAHAATRAGEVKSWKEDSAEYSRRIWLWLDIPPLQGRRAVP